MTCGRCQSLAFTGRPCHILRGVQEELENTWLAPTTGEKVWLSEQVKTHWLGAIGPRGATYQLVGGDC